jgi:hypothetical protein
MKYDPDQPTNEQKEAIFDIQVSCVEEDGSTISLGTAKDIFFEENCHSCAACGDLFDEPGDLYQIEFRGEVLLVCSIPCEMELRA